MLIYVAGDPQQITNFMKTDIYVAVRLSSLSLKHQHLVANEGKVLTMEEIGGVELCDIHLLS